MMGFTLAKLEQDGTHVYDEFFTKQSYGCCPHVFRTAHRLGHQATVKPKRSCQKQASATINYSCRRYRLQSQKPAMQLECFFFDWFFCKPLKLQNLLDALFVGQDWGYYHLSCLMYTSLSQCAYLVRYRCVHWYNWAFAPGIPKLSSWTGVWRKFWMLYAYRFAPLRLRC